MRLSVNFILVSVVFFFAHLFRSIQHLCKQFQNKCQEQKMIVAANSNVDEEEDFTGFDDLDEEESMISDPFESLNRATICF